jgi:hypothetical protein
MCQCLLRLSEKGAAGEGCAHAARALWRQRLKHRANLRGDHGGVKLGAVNRKSHGPGTRV